MTSTDRLILLRSIPIGTEVRCIKACTWMGINIGDTFTKRGWKNGKLEVIHNGKLARVPNKYMTCAAIDVLVKMTEPVGMTRAQAESEYGSYVSHVIKSVALSMRVPYSVLTADILQTP